MKHPPLILASQSPRRVELLREIVTAFDVAPSYATELHDISIGARRLCEVNAQRKAFSVAERFPDHLVLGADTLVFLDGEPLGKPADLAEARVMLGRLAGRVHEVITGVCLIHQRASRAKLLAETTRVKFHPLTAADAGVAGDCMGAGHHRRPRLAPGTQVDTVLAGLAQPIPHPASRAQVDKHSTRD